MKKKLSYILFLVVAFSIGMIKTMAADGLVCYYSGDEVFGYVSSDGNSYSNGASQMKDTMYYPSACVIGVVKRDSGKYQSALHCKGKDDGDNFFEIKISDHYDEYFGVNVSGWKKTYGYKKSKGITKCPEDISFEKTVNNLGNKAASQGEWQAGNFAFSDKYSNGVLKLNSFSEVKKSSWAGMDSYKKELDNIIAGKKMTKKRENLNPSSSTQSPNSTNSTADKELLENIKKAASSSKDPFKIKNGEITCEKLLEEENVKLISNAFLTICVIGVVLVVILGSTDFVKAVASSDDDALAKAWKKFRYRIISVVILLLLPVLVDFILSFVNDNLRFKRIDINGNPNGEVTIEVGKASDCN